MSTPDQAGPPIAPDDDARVFDPSLIAEAPGWPKVIGVLSLIWSIFGLTCMGCMVAGIFGSSFLINMAPPEQRANMAQPPISVASIVLLFLGMGASVVLMIAAISTMRRSPAGRTFHLIWAALSLTVSVAALVEGLLHMPVLIEWAKTQPKSNTGAQMMGTQERIMINQLISTTISSVWPIFCLIWFGLVKRNPRQMLDANA